MLDGTNAGTFPVLARGRRNEVAGGKGFIDRNPASHILRVPDDPLGAVAKHYAVTRERS
jgi:hypothetical protein